MKTSYYTVANIITLVRLFLAPLIGFFIITQRWIPALALFTLAVFSDFFDGFMARLLNQKTALGAFLDHATDKILMIIIFGIFLILKPAQLPAWFCWLVLAKELLLCIGAGTLLATQRVQVVAPLIIGKFAIAAQMILVWWWLLAQIGGFYLPEWVLVIMAGFVASTVLVYGITLMRVR